MELTVAVTEAGVEASEEELCLSWEVASMPAAVWEQEDEEVGLREKEMRDEASVATGWVEVSRLNRSARLSEEGKKTLLK